MKAITNIGIQLAIFGLCYLALAGNVESIQVGSTVILSLLSVLSLGSLFLLNLIIKNPLKWMLKQLPNGGVGLDKRPLNLCKDITEHYTSNGKTKLSAFIHDFGMMALCLVFLEAAPILAPIFFIIFLLELIMREMFLKTARATGQIWEQAIDDAVHAVAAKHPDKVINKDEENERDDS